MLHYCSDLLTGLTMFTLFPFCLFSTTHGSQPLLKEQIWPFHLLLALTVVLGIWKAKSSTWTRWDRLKLLCALPASSHSLFSGHTSLCSVSWWHRLFLSSKSFSRPIPWPGRLVIYNFSICLVAPTWTSNSVSLLPLDDWASFIKSTPYFPS